MSKTDLKKVMKEFYSPPRTHPVFADVPEMRFIMIDGQGDPNKAPAFTEAIETLYGISYTLKFMVKKADPARDYVVMPLEGTWWADDPSVFMSGKRDEWKWTLMIAQPACVTGRLYREAVDQLKKKKKNPPALSKAGFEAMREGLSAQIMHIGPYSEEGPTIKRLHDFIRENGYSLRGKHREIYLGDPRKTAPEKLKTVIRQPVG